MFIDVAPPSPVRSPGGCSGGIACLGEAVDHGGVGDHAWGEGKGGRGAWEALRQQQYIFLQVRRDFTIGP